MKKLITTEDIDPSHRLEFWKDVCREFIGPIEVAQTEPDNFTGRIDLTTVGSLKITQFNSVTQALNRDQSTIKSSDTSDYAILVETDNRFMFDHNGRQHIGTGQMVLVDFTKGYTSRHPDELNCTLFHIPRTVFERVLSPASQLAGLSIGPDQASFHLVANFLKMLQETGALLDAASAERMSSIAVELIAAGIADRIAAEPLRNMSNAATLVRAQAAITERLGKSGLGMHEVAAATGISVRRLQEIAAEEGVSLMDWMWDRRLERAMGVLADPAFRAVSIQAIALKFGFVDQAHFSRRFKQRFGVTPSEARGAGIITV